MLMKNLYLIGGPMGVGKTALGQYLKRSLPNAVMLDGDWCWDADPFVVNDETKEIVVANICDLLKRFLSSTVYINIVFCWVLDQQSTIDAILDRLDTSDCNVRTITLLASEETLRQRILRDVQSGARTTDVLQRSLDRLPRYQSINSQKIYTDGKSVQAVADALLALFP